MVVRALGPEVQHDVGFSADLIVSESGEKAPNVVYRGRLIASARQRIWTAAASSRAAPRADAPPHGHGSSAAIASFTTSDDGLPSPSPPPTSGGSLRGALRMGTAAVAPSSLLALPIPTTLFRRDIPAMGHRLEYPLSRMIQWVVADDSGSVDEDRWRLMEFTGRSMHLLRWDLNALQWTLCVRAGRHGRITPLLIDLPRSWETLHVVLVRPNTAGRQWAVIGVATDNGCSNDDIEQSVVDKLDNDEYERHKVMTTEGSSLD
uniref:DUF569 domain-containing protein n=1 Tax=Oryza glumipatula TaxID=40148 RepID=A0A0D9ZGQ1_9ORYZ